MPNRFCYAVTTYKKNMALRIFLDTLLAKADPEALSHVVICDDNYPEAECVYKEFEPLFKGKLVYIGGANLGIARNKNRGIWYFLEKTEDDHLLLFDDDIEFLSPGLEGLLVLAKWPHITGYLDNYEDPGTKKPFLEIFQPAHETEDLWFCYGSQGVMLYMTRDIVKKVMYFNTDWKGKYGFEHDAYSNRINKVMGFHPKYYAILKWAPHIFKSQIVANNYTEDAKKNLPQYAKIFSEVMEGNSLIVREPSIGKVILHETTRPPEQSSEIINNNQEPVLLS
jgi:glycosyltransferase involved in cell wall biosynthesis